MKTIVRSICFACACVVRALAEDPVQAPHSANLEFVVQSDQIIKEEVHEQGGRDIIVREIEPIALPEPQQPIEPQPIDPAARQQFLERMAARPQVISINAGATVYKSNTSPVRSLVHIPDREGNSVEFWSSADFGLLAGIPNFTGSDGKQRRMMLMWTPFDLDRAQATAARFGKTYKAPIIPVFPAGAATFVVTKGNLDVVTLADVQALHDVYNSKHGELVAALAEREAERIRKEAELQANPPVPKDIILNHWRIEGGEEGGAQ